jgi:sulfur-oxidizing protein SoxA
MAAVALSLAAPLAMGEVSVEEYRAMLADKDANPGFLVIDQGEALFKTKRGPKNATLEKCDFGLGAGKLKGAYAQLPRYFKDTKRVQDLESRLLTCMTTLQGFDASEIKKKTFADQRYNETNTDIEMLAAYVAYQSNGMKINPPLKHPAEKEALKVGEAYFWNRQGPMDFSCATCHAEDALDPKEVAAGNIGPSLTGYGTLRGASDDIVKYTYEKLYNAQATVACSSMPRMGHNGILTPAQVADITAYLVSPESPLNKK